MKLSNKLKISIITCAMLLIFISIDMISVSASAHEIYYEGSVGINLKWSDVTNRTAKLKMNGDYLKGNYASYYSIARNAWPNASQRVSVTDTSFSSSNVDLTVATEDYWNSRFGGSFWSTYVYGICDSTSTDGYQLDSLNNAKASSKRISYAGILYSPYEGSYDNTTHQKMVMVHEIGHALGLGHPNTDYFYTDAASVMRTGGGESYYTPQSHDKTDLNNKY